MVQRASESVVIGEAGWYNQPAREIRDAGERGEDQSGAGGYGEGDLAAAHVFRGFAKEFWGVNACEVASYHVLFPFWREEEGDEIVDSGEERGDEDWGGSGA